jgi:threonine dehydratase
MEGVASSGLELFTKVPDLDVMFVPIGMGSQACAYVAAREALGGSTEIIGVVSSQAPAYRISFQQQRVSSVEVGKTIADGLACRTPHPDALETMCQYLSDIVEVEDDRIIEAMNFIFCDTGHVAEGAGAASLAGALTMAPHLRGKTVGIVLSGANVDSDTLKDVVSTCSASF